MTKQKVDIRDSILGIHQRYVQESAKVEFLAQSFKVMLESIGPVGVNFDGFALALADAVVKMSDLNDDLDRLRLD